MWSGDGGTTNAGLLERVADWGDHPAWSEFYERYDLAIRRWCGTFALDPATADDLRQQIWIELAHRMLDYRYDPGGTFRGWLARLCRCRALDLLRRRKVDRVQLLDDDPDGERALALVPGIDAEQDAGDDRPVLLAEGERVQAAVRRRVDPRTWQAFWRIAVEGGTVRETADELGMSYASAFAAHRRVIERLRAEGALVLAERGQ